MVSNMMLILIVIMSKNIDDDDVINNFLYMLEDSKKPITQVKVKKNLPPIPRSYEPKSDGIHLKVIKRLNYMMNLQNLMT